MSIQERLQLKRVPLDTWNIREQLCLASAVVRSGDQNWMSVSRALKTVGEPNRPPDWYSQKSCAAQYGALLEHVETPKRKKRSSEGAGETPQESIVKRLTQDRIAEIQKNITEMNQQYEQLQNEITEVRNPATSEERLREIWSNIEATKRAQERESARRAALLKEREERRARAARSPRGSLSADPSSPSGGGSGAPPSSPLLTSLLKSSPVVTTPQHIPHPATIVDSISPSVTAPTLSMLLEKSSPQQDSKRERAAIEHIKSQLVQIEQQLKANTPPSPAPLPPAPAPATTSAPTPAAALDIDDIEINAEDVYVFRDVDIPIPTVTSHAQDKIVEKPVVVKDEHPPVEVEVEPVQPPPEELTLDQEQPEAVEEIKEELPPDVETVLPEAVTEAVTVEVPPAAEVEDVKISFPEVKFPTTEIKVIQPDEQKIKEESKEAEVVEENKQAESEVVASEVIVEQEPLAADSVEQQMSELHGDPSPPPSPAPCPLPSPSPSPPPACDLPPLPPPAPAPVVNTPDIPLPGEPHPTELPLLPDPEPLPAVPDPPPEETEVKREVVEVKPEVTEVQPDPEVPPDTSAPVQTAQDDKFVEDFKRDEDAEDSIPLKQMIREESLRTRDGLEETHTETDDDTPMELSREEEKDGKKKRDYSRKKKPDSRTCSGSESATEASAPDSPHANDAERHHRLWKKSVMLVYSRLCAHKYASLFLRPITDDEAPGYSVVVKRPMDLSTIRKNIESGVVRTTSEFQRDVLLMLCNALMYNSSEHSVYSMAKEMHEEAASQLGMLLAAQAHAALEDEPPARRKRRRPAPEPRHSLHKRGCL